MRFFGTLPRYIARTYLMALMFSTALVVALLLLFDVIEIMRSTGSREVEAEVLVEMALYRLPMAVQSALPFVFMGAAVLVFWRLARSSELIIVRASGVSVWQFLAPIMTVVLVMGVCMVTLFNPLAADMFARYEQMQRTMSLSDLTPMVLTQGGLWLREGTEERQVVLHAEGVRQENNILRMTGVVIFEYDGRDVFLRRIDAQSGGLAAGRVQLTDAVINQPGYPPQPAPTYSMPTSLSLPRIQDSFAPPESVSFWDLPRFIAFFDAAGFSAHAHRLHWHSLLASPLLLVSMVLMGAVFTLKPSQRSVNWLFRVVGAVGAGFGVFFFAKITYTLGLSQTLPVGLAAWTPVLVTGLVGLAILFHLEDG